MERTFVLVCIAVASVVSSRASSRHPIPTSLCEVLSRPGDWNNKVVSLTASYYSDGLHGSVLADDHCDNAVVEVSFVKKFKCPGGVECFAGWGLRQETFDRAVTGTWVGRFYSDYGKFHERFLSVRTSANLAVLPIDFSNSDTSPIHTTLYDIVAHPKVFDHKTVIFDSEYMTDARHGSIVFECGLQGIGRGILIRSISGAKGEDTLNHALQQGHLATLDKTIRAEWTGRLSWFPNPIHGAYEIQITAIRNLTVVMHPDAVPCESEPKAAPPHS